MINIDDKNIKEYVKNLKSISKSAYPKVIRSVLDRMAFLGLKELKKNIKKSFTIRNASSNIILKSLHYSRCSNSLDINSMESKMGQLATTFSKATDQIRKQEFGEFIHAQKNHIMKPTKKARGGSYKRAVRNQNYLNKIKVKRIDELVKTPANPNDRFKQAVGYAKHNPDKPFYFVPDEAKKWGNNIFLFNGDRKRRVATPLYAIKGESQKLNPVPVVKPAGVEASKQSNKIFAHEAERRIYKELNKNMKKT